ncbi:MAG: nicotinate-nucleotide adenylyltransferase [Acidobacteriota bacterium]
MSVLQKMRKRIAIYGGTFDPVHSGHMEIARQVSQLFVIDEFLFVPAWLAPHKIAREVLPALHRYAMLALATGADPRLSISTFELDGPGRQYTVDTLFHFRELFGESVELFFVMGADSWAEITTWREWRRLLTLANLIVVTRPGYEISTAQVGVETSTSVFDLRGAFESAVVDEPGVPKIFVTDAVMLDISATKIRRAVGENDNEKLNELVPLEVAEYIRKYRLYRNTNEQ